MDDEVYTKDPKDVNIGYSPYNRPEPPRPASFKSGYRIAVLVCSLLAAAWKWNSLSPLKSKTPLTWWSCPDDHRYECAYLEVPLNYVDPVPGEHVYVFLRKFPAKVSRSEKLGSLLVNPGGPGGSGNLFILEAAESISTVVEGKYDIVSWDPRGVNMTTPSLDCYTADSESLLLQLAHKISGTPLSARGPSHLPEHYRNLSEFMFTKQYDEYLKAPAMACNAFGNQRMLKAVTTSFVVRDIVSILEALNEEGGLNYWGNDYWEWQRRGIQDARKTISGFFEKCAEAGPEKCPFAKGPPDQSLKQRYDAIFERLLEAPVSAISEQTGLGVFKASDMQELFFEMMYHPDGWANLAQGLADLESGNATILYDSSYSYFSDVRRETNAKDNVFHRHVEKYGSFIWTLAITCTDTPNMNAKPGDEGVKEYLQYLHELLEISPTGESWAVWAGFCRHWKVEPFERYAGPWTVEEGLERTKFPILFVSMTADPVTPLPSAQRMNAAFGNDSSTLLIQQGYGHTSLAQPSLCTAKTIREYFVGGMVPLNGTTCQTDSQDIFTHQHLWSKADLAGDDRILIEAFEQIHSITRLRNNMMRRRIRFL